MPGIRTSLWFDTEGEEAARFYTSLFPNSEVTGVTHYTEAGPRPVGQVLTVDFTLDGQRFTAINGGPEFTFDEAVSVLIECADQAEVDRYWAALTEGGEEGPCGWLKDRYGLSWQVVPLRLNELTSDPDPGRARRATEAMFGMKKIDVAALEAAADAG
ncbi:VOC family protein [Streptomyces avicenniae]|uniref:VOC family protein n=1 Tax=Streptomyces avicenniae TaxID=500153 RepID=UPI000699FED3|nr:VOC family protein [Streptomyces avicenniae]